MDRLDRLADRVSRALAFVGAAGVLALLVHVTLDVVTRNAFGQPIPATNEVVSRYYMVLIAFLPLAWVERQGGMISVGIIDGALGDRLKRASDALAALIYAGIAWVTLADALKAWRAGSFVDVLGLALPVWPSSFLPPAGFLLAALVTLHRAVRLGFGSART